MRRRSVLFGVTGLPIAFRRLLANGNQRSVTLAISVSGRPIMAFQNGFWPVIDSDNTVLVLDTNGNVVGRSRISAPDATVSQVYTAVATREKVIIAGAMGKDSAGRFAALLVFSDFEGNIIRAVRTTPFAASKFVTLPDNTLVCLGREHDDSFEDVPGHRILRFYSPAGQLRRQALAIDSLLPGRGKRDLHPLNWHLAAGQDRIGLLDGEGLRYAEVDFNGDMKRTLGPLGIDSAAQVNGIALLANGDRLLSTRNKKDRPATILRLRDSNRQLTITPETSITGPDGSTAGLIVLGVYRDEIVLLSNATHLVFAPQG